MNRRGFLALLAPAALVVPALVIARKSFFLPPSGGWPDTGLTADKLRAFKRAMLEQAYRESYPPVVMADESVINSFDQRPGAVNYGVMGRYEGFNFVTTDRHGRIVPYVLNG